MIGAEASTRKSQAHLQIICHARQASRNLKTSLSFSCLGLNPIIYSIYLFQNNGKLVKNFEIIQSRESNAVFFFILTNYIQNLDFFPKWEWNCAFARRVPGLMSYVH